MERLFKSVLSIRELKFHVDDDYVDRLSRQFTVMSGHTAKKCTLELVVYLLWPHLQPIHE